MPHPANRQKGEQNEVDQGKQEPFGKGAQFLQRYPAGQDDVFFLHEADHASQGVRGKPNVRVKKDKIRMRGVLSEHRASVLLAAPAGGQGGAVQRPHPAVARSQFLHYLRRSVLRAVVEDEDFDLDAAAG